MTLILLATVVFLLFVIPVLLILAFVGLGENESTHLTQPSDEETGHREPTTPTSPGGAN